MNNDKGEMTQNDERPLSNREARDVLRLTICLEHGPIEEGNHAEVQRRHRLLRTVPSQMKHHFKGYKPKALAYKDNLVSLIGEWLDEDEWLHDARGMWGTKGRKSGLNWWDRSGLGRSPVYSIGGLFDVVAHSLVHRDIYDSHHQVINTIRLVSEPSFAAKHWKTEEVAA